MSIIGVPHVEPLDDDFDYDLSVSGSGRQSVEWTAAYNVYVDSANEPETVIAWARENLPHDFDGKPRIRFRISEEGLINPGEYKFILSFKTPENDDEAGDEINPIVTIDCVQGRTRMRYSLKTVQTFHHKDINMANTYDFFRGINVSDQGIQGAEIVAPSFTWSETWTMSKVTATWAYLSRVGAMRGKLNAGTFRGKEARTVLFLGIRARQKDRDNLEVVFNFDYSPHEAIDGDQFPNFPQIDGKIKEAHDYIWAYNRERKEGIRLIQQPVFISIERVYKTADFAIMQIGQDLPSTANILPGQPG